MENDIDEIFKNGIESMDTEPSEEFWRKAAEDVLSRGNKANERKVAYWRFFAFILATALFVLGYFAYKMQVGLTKVEQQVAAIKDVRTQNPAKENIIVNNSDKDTKIVTTVKSTNRTEINKKQHTKPLGNIYASTSSYKNNSRQTAAATKDLALTNQSDPIVQSHGNNAIIKDEQKNPASEPIQVSATSSVNKSEPGQTNKTSIASTSERGQTNVTSVANTKEVPVNAPGTIQKDTNAHPKQVSEYVLKANQASSKIMPDTLKTAQKELPLRDSSSKFSISAFFSPDFMAGYKFKPTDSWGSAAENIIKSGEKQSFSYSAGTKAAYAVSSNFSISAGLSYEVFSFNSNTGTVYAQKQSDGVVGYYLTTSSGIVECPYYGVPNIGDSLKMSASSTRRYIEIPVQVKYNFVNKENYQFYLNAGLEVSIGVGETTSMNWQNFSGESGVAVVNGTENSRSTYFSYYMGIGANYKIGKCLSLYLEPGLHTAITSIDDNVSVITYPRLISITTGLTYHLR